MKKEITRFLKPVFDENPVLGQLLTGTDVQIGFDELVAKGFLKNTWKAEYAESLGPEKPCLVVVYKKKKDDFGFSCKEIMVHFNIVCLNEYLFCGERQLRPYEIAKHLNNAIDHKVKWDKYSLVEKVFDVQSLNDKASVFFLGYELSVHGCDKDYNNDYDIFRCYKKYLLGIVDEVFDDEEIKKQLFINGVSATGLSVDELLKNKYIRFGTGEECDTENDSIFVNVNLTQSSFDRQRLEFQVTAKAGTGGQGISKDRMAAKFLSYAIIKMMMLNLARFSVHNK